ncbi:UDP-glucose 4-epimerase GalE [Alphaproteobacteria bacterium]|nr:UDP-glucose 4-epimerase GalE [Alphaproteobacteria bacterium]
MNKNKILVVGGAGYIGSHMVKYLANRGFASVVLDNLSTGHAQSARYGQLVVGDLVDQALLDQLFSEHEFVAVMHFAAASLVGESMVDPAKYYRNNVGNTLNLLDSMVKHSVMDFIFSSTAAIFGEPHYTPIDELHPKSPINPYGASKLMIERILEDYAAAYGLNSVCLRYFNACGADPGGDLGELHDPETHLIPLVLQAASGRRKYIKTFGSDYPTPDGTCVRDYIHILDLCQAHHKALEKLLDKSLSGAQAFNLGNGNGFSVKEVIETAESVVNKDGKSIIVEESERRPGDPAVLVADAKSAVDVINWQPEYISLKEMLEHAWAWEKVILDD